MINLVEGWTDDIDYQLKADGVAYDLTGATVTIQAASRTGSTINLAGTVTVTDPATGMVRFSPAAGDITQANHPIYVRFAVVHSGKKKFFPNKEAEIWNIRR